jgi:hypothetical protein
MLARIAVGLFAISVSAAAIAAPCAGFVDVDDSNATYCSAVTYVKNKGITLGCTDAAHYCPSDYVTRLQMALFLQRAGRGSASNELFNYTAVIGGGENNITQDQYATVGGGSSNLALASASTVAGGAGNTASGVGSTVGGGGPNTASGNSSTVAGGNNNTASGLEGSTVAGGASNTASGQYSIAVGGSSNTASGDWSFAAGYNAQATQLGCFVWADHSIADPIGCFANTFVVRAFGGVAMATGGSNPNYTGARLAAGSGSWSTFSDRNGKENVQATEATEVLAKVVSLPIATWNWKSQATTIRHMGPMAQDFYASFGLGEDDKHIATVDSEGVALAAIQGLNVKLEVRVAEQEREIAELRERVSATESLRGELAALRAALAELRRPPPSVAAK